MLPAGWEYWVRRVETNRKSKDSFVDLETIEKHRLLHGLLLPINTKKLRMIIYELQNKIIPELSKIIYDQII